MTDKSTSLITVSVALAAVFTLGGGEALALCTPYIFPNTDTPYITVCDGDEDIRIDLNDEDITATVSGIRGSGIVGWSHGNPSGDVTINVQGVSITTDSTTDTLQDLLPSSGISAVINDPRADSPDGKISVTAKDVTILTSGGRGSHGIYGFNYSKRTDNPDANPDANPDVDIDIEDSSITTEGSLAHGIFGEHRGDGDVNIGVLRSRITSGDYHGIYGLRALSGDRADTTGDIHIDARDSIITTKKAYLNHGIYAKNEGITKTIFNSNVNDYVSYVVSNGYASGDIHIDVEGVTITTESTYVDSGILGTESHGIYGRHLGKGDINIDVQGGTTITTKGVNSYGIYGYHEDVLGDGTPGSNGDINIDVQDSSITTFGEGSHGILAEHDSGMGFIDILVKRGAIHASGTGASGVKVGLLDNGEVTRAGGLDEEDGYRKQTVTVNGRVMGNEAGVYLAGGGRVIIGSKGSVGAKSGIAILATGDTPVEGGDPIKPKLYLDMNLAGRRIAQVIGNNWIINDGGETTIAVNGVELHEGANGVVRNAVAANGAWNVTMREHGVKVDDSTADRVNWTFTQSTDVDKITKDRDFSVQDFMQAIAGRTQMARTQCSDATLTTQAPITNEEAADSTTDLSVNADGVKISATGGAESGIHQVHHGEGDINVNVRSSCVETSGTSNTGDEASGVLASSDSATDPATNEGTVKVDVRDSTIMTEGPRAKGIVGGHTHTGGIDIDVSNTNITTTGERATGIFGQYNTGTGGTGDLTIDATDVTISTGGNRAGGIWGLYTGPEGDMTINTRGGSITTNGGHNEAFGIRGSHNGGSGKLTITAREGFNIDVKGNNGRGIWGERIYIGNPLPSGSPDDDIVIRLSDGEITTRGYWGDAIYADHRGPGMIDIDLKDVTIETQNTVPDPRHRLALSRGILAVHRGTGDVNVNVHGGSIRTWGGDGTGIDARNTNTGSDFASMVRVTTLNTPITTWGEYSHGIYARQYGSNAERAIAIDVGGDIHVIGMKASGVRAGSLSNSDEVINAGGLDEDGYRRQTVTVNGRVIGNEAGVYLAGGGRVIIGPKGSVGAKSGIAILATGDTPVEGGDPIKPKLYLDMNLDGRRVAQVIGNNWIINDEGETTIAVNGVELHDGVDGVTERTAPNGAWNVTMAGPGVRVTDRTDPDPANWITEASDTPPPPPPAPADRDFSANDFTETAVPPCPPGRIGRHPNCRIPPPPPPVEPEPLPEPLPEPEPEPEPETGMPMFMEEYAPRAAVYEVLPDFMLRMQNGKPTGPRLFLPESPVYIRLLESTGSQEFKHSTVNANYDAGRFAVEAGVNIPLFENLDIWASMHHVTGSADVSSPVNGGDIDVTGAGLSLDAYWSGEDDYYATGRLSLTDYDIDLSSNTIGRLKSNGDANGQSVHVEAGRRMTLSENSHWTPRAWLGHTRISVDKFTDAVDSRVSFSNTDRFTGGLGVMAETVRAEYGGGELLLRGSLDFEQKFGDSRTVALVSGERLSAEPEKSSALLSLSGTWNKGSFKFSAELSARQDFNSGGEDYSGVIHVGMRF